MKAGVLVSLLSLTLLLSACSESGYPLSGGGRADLLAEERVLFVNYWAVWCAPCIAEMPELAEFSHTHADRAVVYAVNFDGPEPEQLRADIEALGVDIPALEVDPQAELGYPRPEVLPTTFVLSQGRLVKTLVGPQTIDSLAEVLDEVAP